MAGLNSQIAIYALSDEDGVVRYVGKTVNPDNRLRQHIGISKKPRTPVQCWIKREMAQGRKVSLNVVAWVDEKFWRETERALIAGLRPYGRLLNLADGGDEPQRSSYPDAQARWRTKNTLRWGLKNGFVDERTKALMRSAAVAAPHWFGEWASV